MKLSALLLLAIILVGCSTQQATPSIKVGGLYTLSGNYVEILKGAATGTRMALEDFKAETGKEVQFIEEDDKSCADKVNPANKLVNIDHVQAIVGVTCSSMMLSIAPITAESKTVVISGGSSSSSVTTAGPHVFRTFASDAAKGKQIAAEIKMHGYKRVALLYGSDDDADTTAINDVRKNLQSAEVVADEGASNTDGDFRTSLLKIKEAKPDVLVIAFNAPSAYAKVMEQKQQLGIMSVTYAGIETIENDKVIELGGKNVEGILYPYFAEPSGATYERFRARYKQKYGEEVPAYAAESYDAAMITLKAIAQSDGTQDDIIRNMQVVGTNYSGVSGIITFDENGDVQKSIEMKMIKDGKFVKV